MTTLQVGDNQTYQTIGAALEAAAIDDVIEVQAGTYREQVKITKRVTLRGVDKPLIDGLWKGGEVTGNPPLLLIAADGATVEGMRIENSPGRGITIAANEVTVRDCHVRNTRMDGLVANGITVKGLRNILVEDSTFIGLSQKMAGDKSDQAAGSSFVIVYVIDSTFRRNIVGEGYKEGFNIDKNTSGCLYERNVLFNTGHGGCYFNHCQNNIVTNNVFLHTTPERYRGARGAFPAAVIFGDERAAESRGVDKSHGNHFVGNVCVGWGRFLEVRNNSKDPGGYDTQLLDTVIRNNTFIAGPETTAGIEIAANLYGRPHQNSRFTDNIVSLTGAKAGADIGTMGAGGGVTFERNAWSVQPPRTMQGEGDVYGDPGLMNPGANLSTVDGPPFIDYTPDNYRPTPGGPSDGRGALPPLQPPPPPDPTPDLAAIADMLAEVVANIGAAGTLIGGAVIDLSELIAKLRAVS